VRIRPTASLFEPSIMRRAAGQAFVKLDPRTMVHIPVMFVVEIGSVVTSIEFFARPDVFVGLVTLWLWATVLFANFAEAVAEGRGKAQADTLRRSRQETSAWLLKPDGSTPGRSFPVTATWWRAWPWSTSRRSRASRPR
jgi:K+-transporting ATPase ATPase B chain